MNKTEFWLMVDSVKDAPDRTAAMCDLLKQLSPDEIFSYQDHFKEMSCCAYRSDLWGAADLLNGGCSDDGFEYFRSDLISRGRKVFEDVVKNPDLLADYWGQRIDNESFGCAAYDAYEAITGRSFFDDMPPPPVEVDEEPITGLPSIPEIADWDFDDEDEYRKWLPRLSNLAFGIKQ